MSRPRHRAEEPLVGEGPAYTFSDVLAMLPVLLALVAPIVWHAP